MALQHLRSSTAHKRPIPTVMSAGQIAINTNEASPALFFKDSNGDLVKVGPVHIGTDAPNSSPASVAATALVTGTVYQILTVGTSDFTLVGASANTVGTIFTATGTTTGTGTVSGQQGVEKGEMWLDTTGGTYVLKIYDGSAWRSESGTFVDSAGDTMTGALLLDNAASASAPDLSFDGDADTGIYSPGADQLAFATNGTGRMFIDSSNRVGVGTSSPSADLHVKGGNFVTLDLETTGGSTNQIKFSRSSGGPITTEAIVGHASSDNSFSIQNQLSGPLLFANNATERMRIDSSGRLLVGTSSSLLQGEVIQGAGSNESLGMLRFRNDAAGPEANFYKTRATTNAHGLVSNNDAIGTLNFRGSDGSSYIRCALIEAAIDGTPGTNDMPGRLVFSTTADGASSPTERMRIDSLGNVGVGTTVPTNYGGNFRTLEVAGSSGNDGGVFSTVTADSAVKAYFYTESTSNTATIGTVTNHPLLFRTNSIEQMRIDSAGRLLVNRSSSTSNGAIAQFSSSVGPHISLNNTTAAGTFMLFQNSTSGDGTTDGLYVGTDGNLKGYLWNYESGLIFGNNGAAVGQFIGSKFNVPGVYNGTTTGGGAVYVESDGDLLRYTSSLKYKTDVETLEDARADAILNCRPVWYRSKCENDIKTEGAEKSDWGWYGFIAEEVAEIEPRLVNWATKDAVTQEDGSYKSVERDPADYEAEGVRYDNFVPLMLNLIKRQKAQIETLEQRLSDAGIA
jgi:hypothetical protein